LSCFAHSSAQVSQIFAQSAVQSVENREPRAKLAELRAVKAEPEALGHRRFADATIDAGLGGGRAVEAGLGAVLDALVGIECLLCLRPAE